MNFNLPDIKDVGCGAYIVAIMLAIALAFGMSCLYAWVGMLLWNWVVVGELGLFATEIGFWPMWGHSRTLLDIVQDTQLQFK